MKPSLTVVPENRNTVADRIKNLQAQAQGLARDHVQSLIGALAHVEALAAEIAQGGDAYPPGVRDIARRLVEDCESRSQTIEAIAART